MSRIMITNNFFQFTNLLFHHFLALRQSKQKLLKYQTKAISIDFKNIIKSAKQH